MIRNKKRWGRWEVDLFEIRKLAVPGVFALINDAEKKLDIRHSHNCIQSIARHATELEQGSHPCKQLLADRDKLSVEILEVVPDYQRRLLAHTRWCNKFLEESYSFYRLRKALNYEAKIVIENYEARVKLFNKNHDSFVVGCFYSMAEAQAFIDQYYRASESITAPIYCSNELTRGYLTNNGYLRSINEK